MGDNLKQKTISALKWSTVDRFGQQAVQFIVGIVLARLLNVDDYGLIGMIAIFNALSFILIESGFGQSLIRKQSTDNNEFSSIFYFNLSIGVFIYIILFFSAPLIAQFFKQPELIKISRVAFMVIPFNALYLMQFIKLGLKLDYKNIAKVNIFSTLISGTIGVIMALSGYGVWALVWQQVSYHFVRLIIFYVVEKWIPARHFSLNYIREHWKFSINLLGTGVLNVIFNNIFLIILGRFFSLQETGLYSQANKQADTVNYTFMAILTGSTYNIFSQIQEDIDRLRRILKEFIHKVAVVAIPIGFFLIGSANDLIVSLIGNQWLGSVPFFRLLVAANLVAPLYLLNNNALNSRGFSRTTFHIELIKKALILIAIIGLFHWGAKVMIAGYVLASWTAYFISMRATKKNINYFWSNQIKDILPAICIGLLIGAITFAISLLEMNHFILLAFELISAGIIYIISIRLFYKELFDKALTEIKKVIKNNIHKI